MLERILIKICPKRQAGGCACLQLGLGLRGGLLSPTELSVKLGLRQAIGKTAGSSAQELRDPASWFLKQKNDWREKLES
jgi:hypothetical protein